MLGNPHFYHRTIRKVVVGFGTLFNDIHIIRYNKDLSREIERFRVPLSYGSKEKYFTRLTSDPNLTKSIATLVPRISFELTGMSYDSSRKQISTTRNYSANTSTSVNAQYVPVPYNFEFDMAIYVRNTEDGSQILEQILPFFTPDFTVTIDFVPSIGLKYDMPVILNSVTPSTEYEGDLMNTRMLLWDLSFTAKGYIYPPTSRSSIITVAQANTFTDTANTSTNANTKIGNIVTTPSPNTASPEQAFGFSQDLNEFL